MKAVQILILSSLLILCLSCKRDEAEKPAPLINALLPVENQIYNLSDTVFVKANISHQLKLEFVSVSIVNEFSTPILPVKTIYPETNNLNLETSFVFDDILIESGNYSVLIKAEADGELAKEWVGIIYNSPEKKLLSLITITNSPGLGYSVYDLIPGNQLHELFTFPGDFGGSAFSSRYQLLFTAGSVTNDLVAWDIENRIASWNIPAQISPPLPYFNAVYSDNYEVFVSNREAYIDGYSASGINTFHSTRFTNGYFTSLLKISNRLVSVFAPFNSQFSEIVVFNYPGGTVFRRLQFEGTIAGMCHNGDESLFLFINHDGVSSVYEYEITPNSMVLLKEFQQGSIRKVTMPDQQNGFLVFSDGIYWYKPEIGSLVKYLSAENVSDLDFDPLSGKLFISSLNLVNLYQIPSVQPVETFTMADSIVGIELHYNK